MPKLSSSAGLGGPVRIQGPFDVIAIVCSKWALGRPSCVDCVQWSFMALTFFVPMLTIGSTAMTSPGSRRKSLFRRN